MGGPQGWARGAPGTLREQVPAPGSHGGGVAKQAQIRDGGRDCETDSAPHPPVGTMRPVSPLLIPSLGGPSLPPSHPWNSPPALWSPGFSRPDSCTRRVGSFLAPRWSQTHRHCRPPGTARCPAERLLAKRCPCPASQHQAAAACRTPRGTDWVGSSTVKCGAAPLIATEQTDASRGPGRRVRHRQLQGDAWPGVLHR